MSKSLNSSSAFSLVSFVSNACTWMSGFRFESLARAASLFGLPTSLLPNVTCRCRFVKSTTSKSTRPNLPTPAAAKYKPSGAPSPPVPISSTFAFFSFNCPSMPTSGMIRCRLYRRISSFVRFSVAFTPAGVSTFVAICSPLLPRVAPAGCRFCRLRLARPIRPPDAFPSAFSPRNRGNNIDRIPVLRRCLFLCQVPYIFAIHIHVHEAPQPSLFREQVSFQIGKLARQSIESLSDISRREFSGHLPTRVRTKWRRYQHSDSHIFLFLSPCGSVLVTQGSTFWILKPSSPSEPQSSPRHIPPDHPVIANKSSLPRPPLAHSR